MQQIKRDVYGEEEMLAYGELLASKLSNVSVIYLYGNLGMGKTTLVRGFLKGYGYDGAVKSPTYTIVEPYEFSSHSLYHFDLYRVVDPEELEYMGIRDYFDGNSLSLIEWPDKGVGYLPEADVTIHIDLIENGRSVCIDAMNEKGKLALESFV